MEMAQVRAKKGRGLGDLLSTLTPGTVEEIKRISVPQHPVALMLQKYEQIYRKAEMESGPDGPDIMRAAHKFIADQLPERMAPAEIDSFLSASLLYADYPYYHYSLGLFVNRLLYNAITHREGYNSFTLHTSVCGSPSFIAENLRGSEQWRVQLLVEGSLGIECGRGLEYVDLHVSGTVGTSFAAYARHCQFSFDDILGERAGFTLKPCRNNYSIVRTGLGKQVLYNGRDAADCTFIVRTKSCAEMLAESLPLGNKVVYRADGNDFILRDFDHEPTQ